MKHLSFFLLLLLFAGQAFAQRDAYDGGAGQGGQAGCDFPRLEDVYTNSKRFSGKIDKYDITLFVKYHDVYATERYENFSVKGWYFYNRVGEKIPLIGYADYGSLVLYHYKDMEAIEENEDAFIDPNSSIPEGYEEGFIFSSSDTKGTWTNGKKTFDVQLDGDAWDIGKKHVLLRNQ